MALFSLNSPSAPLSSLDPLQGIRANKMGKFRHCKMMMDIYLTYSKRYTVCENECIEINPPIKKSSKGL